MTISTREWSVKWLLERSKNFKPACRVSCNVDDLDNVIEQYEEKDVPLVIEGWHQTSQWPTKFFNMDFCRQYFRNENKEICARNVLTRSDQSMTFEDFLERSRTNPTFAKPEETQRWYGKDVECPRDWEEWLLGEGVIPAQLLPGGGNDLLALRPQRDGRPDVETLMCYFGVADTYTPCHKDQCASSGQNLMCYTEDGSSSFWFMTKGSDCFKVADYFHNLNHELDHETHVMSLSELEGAPFDIYIVEQKLGDLVLVPPRSCHQVVNSGKMTIKMSWSRITLSGLAAAFYYELPLYRRVCRPETYQIRSTIYYVLTDYTAKLKTFISKPFDSIQKDTITKRLVEVLRLYDHILIEEYSPYGDFLEIGKETPGQNPELAEDFQMCDFCGADIFQSYFQCSKSNGPEASSIICSGCYAEGRTCACECMDPKQRQKSSILLSARWEALEALKNTGYSMKTFEGSETQKEQKIFIAQKSERSIFQAAMLVHNMRLRNKTRQSRKCRLNAESHLIPATWAISCKKCHSSKCFPHLLDQYRMHCIPALFLVEQDDSHVAYHSGHAAKFPDYNVKEKFFLRDQREKPSNAPNFDVQLVYNASNYPVCQPLNATNTHIGWYDRLPPVPKAVTKERKPQPRLTSSTGGSDSEVDESDSHGKSRFSAVSSQRSMKNHAYVDIKPRISTAPPRIISQQISVSPLTSDPEDSDSEDMSPPPHLEKPLKRDLPHYSQKVVDLEPGTVSSSTTISVKRRHESQAAEPSGNGTVFAAVHRIGPPRKKRRQESEPRSREAQSKEPPSRPTKVKSKMREDETHNFAAALGAAINQVAKSATRTMKERQHRKGDVEEVKKRSGGNSNSMQQPVMKATVRGNSSPSSIAKRSVLVNDADLPDMKPLPPTGPILVNVADLQDIITNAAEQVAKKIVEETSSTVSLATKSAVAMMTSFAAAGKFVESNTQLEFPSMRHFREASRSTVKISEHSTVKGSSSMDQRQPKALAEDSGVHSGDNHHQIRETTISIQSSSGHATQRKGPLATSFPSRASGPSQKKRPIVEDET